MKRRDSSMRSLVAQSNICDSPFLKSAQMCSVRVRLSVIAWCAQWREDSVHPLGWLCLRRDESSQEEGSREGEGKGPCHNTTLNNRCTHGILHLLKGKQRAQGMD